MEAPSGGRDDILRLFVRHQVMLGGYLYSVVEDWELVEEALQETAVFLLGRWQDFTPGTNFAAWARQVARMRCREILAKRKAQGLTVEGDELDEIVSSEWESQEEFSPAHKEALARCLKMLPDRQRRVIEMHYMERKACDRVAVHFKSSVEAIYMALSRIRRRLKNCVEQRLARESA